MADPSAELASAVITRRNDAARPMFAVGELLLCLPEIDFSSGPLEGRLRALRDEMLYSACRPPKIAVYGATGKGKSTLLNAIAGADVLHFSNRGISCTRVPTELWSRRTSEETTYAVVEFDFFCGEEWLAQRKHLAELAGARNPDDDNQPYEASSSSSDPAKKELSRVYLPHAAHVFPAELQPANNANKLTAEQIDFLHRMPLASEPQIIRDLYTHNREHHVLDTAADVKHKLHATCTVADARTRSSTIADSADRQGTPLELIERSSLIKLARVTGVNGFFPGLPDGACVVDTPGVGDVDAINVERAQAFQRNNATHTWICIEGPRAGSDVEVQDLMYETAKLIADGKVGSMSVLLLKSDVWLYNESDSAHDELMARLTEHTDEVRELLSGSIQARVEQENVEFRTKVISAMRDAKMINVSARDYITLSPSPWGPMRTPQFKDLSETGVPKLMEIIQEQASLHEKALQDIKKEIANCISEEIDEAERNACEVERQLAADQSDGIKAQLRELAQVPNQHVTALTGLLVSINGMPEALQGRIDDLTQQCDASIKECATQACSLHFKTLQAALRRHGGPIRSSTLERGTEWINLNARIAFKLLTVLTTSWTAVFSPEFVSRALLRQVLADVQSAIDAVLAGANVAGPAGNSGAERLDFRANLLARNASGCLAQLRTATGLSDLLEGSAKQALAGDLYDQVWAGTGVKERMHAAVPEAYPLVYPVAWDVLMRPVRQASTELMRMVREAVQHQVSIAINLIENSTVHPSGVPDEEARSNTYRSLANEMIRSARGTWTELATELEQSLARFTLLEGAGDAPVLEPRACCVDLVSPVDVRFRACGHE